MRRLAAIGLLLLAAVSYAAGGPRFRRFRINDRLDDTPAPFFTALTSISAECDGSAISGVTHTNATTTRYCQKSDGALVAVTANQPRVNNNGVLVEGARTNPVQNNMAFDTWTRAGNVDAVVADSSSAFGDPVHLDGVGTTAEAINCQSGLGGCTTSDYLQSAAFVPGQTTLTASLWGINAAGDTGFIIVRDTTAGVDRATCTGLEVVDGLWTRWTCNASGLTAGNNHVLRVGQETQLSINGVEPFAIWGAQAEAPTINFRSSTIPTAGSSVNRANDVYTFVGQDMTAAGCLSATVTFSDQSSQLTGTVFGNGTEKMLGAGSATTITANDGTNTVTATVSSVLGRTIDVKVKWSAAIGLVVIADGVTASGSFDGAFSSTSTMRIGATAAASGYFNGWIKNIKAGTNPESCQ